MSDEEDDPPKCGDKEIDAHKRDDKDNPPGCNYAIGRGKTPIHTRFTKGHKRGGRPRGSKNTKTLMTEIWHEKRPALVKGKRVRIGRREAAVRRLAARAEDGDIKAFEIFEKAEISESGGTRQAGSRFDEPADALTMADIIRRIRNMPAEEPTPQSELEEGAGDGENLSRAAEEGNGDSPADEQKDLP
jgi:hypothetical protein